MLKQLAISILLLPALLFDSLFCLESFEFTPVSSEPDSRCHKVSSSINSRSLIAVHRTSLIVCLTSRDHKSEPALGYMKNESKLPDHCTRLNDLLFSNYLHFLFLTLARLLLPPPGNQLAASNLWLMTESKLALVHYPRSCCPIWHGRLRKWENDNSLSCLGPRERCSTRTCIWLICRMQPTDNYTA